MTHHIVEFQQVLSNFEVAGFDLLLRFFEGLVDPGMNDGLAFLEPQTAQHAIHPFRPEYPHQVVFQGDEEF